MPPGLLIAAPASGAGKTTVMLGLLGAMRRAGVSVQAFKSGPDYIDPAFHAAASGRASFNLDSWAMSEALIGDIQRVASDADLVLAEGSMGLLDGAAQCGAFGIGASADIAALMGWPVVLVLDVAGQAQSAAAVAHGFATLRSDLTLAGVILNQVASPRHDMLVRSAMAEAGIAVFGALPRHADVVLPERHLGLVQASEHEHLKAILDALANLLERHVDLAALRAVARGIDQPQKVVTVSPPGGRIALARDDAFSFIYPHLIARWRAAGATIVPFSPLADEQPDMSADVCWLSGGYPELHAGRLAAAERFCKGLRIFAETRPVHGECGGYMAMGEGLIDASGVRHAMTGLLGLVTSFEKRRMHLGYRLATLAAAIPGHGAGVCLRGHEFHYATITEQPDPALAQVVDASGHLVAETGSWRGYATGTFFHLIAEAA